MAKKEPKERLDRTTKLVLTNMLRTRILPLLEKEQKRVSALEKEAHVAYEKAIAAYNQAAEPAKLLEARRRPSTYITVNGLGGPQIDSNKLEEWYSAKHPRPEPPISNEEKREVVYFSALYDERAYNDSYALHVPKNMAAQIRQLANAIDMAFLTGTAVGLIEAINDTAKALGEGS